jgi:cysteinyl-tRNA synthetase
MSLRSGIVYTGILTFIFLALFSCNKEGDEFSYSSQDTVFQKIRFWAYQLEGLDREGAIDSICDSHYDLIVMDQLRSLKGTEDHDTKADITRIKNSPNSRGGKKIVLCYIDVGQAESYRYYWENHWSIGEPSWILAPDPDGWNENYGVKFWDSQWVTIIEDYIGKIIDDGFDGIYMDWLQIYSTTIVKDAAAKEHALSEELILAFVRELSQFAWSRKNGFLMIAQNAPELGSVPGYIELFNGIAQEDIWFDGSGDPDDGGMQGDVAIPAEDSEYYIEELKKWKKAGKTILNVEYAQLPVNVSKAYSNGTTHNYKSYVTLRLLDRLTQTPPPGY